MMRLPPAVPSLSRDYEDVGEACRWASKQGILPTREIIAPPCAAGARQTRPRVGDDVSALARLNIDFAGASFDNVRRPQPCCSKVYSSTAMCQQAYIKLSAA